MYYMDKEYYQSLSKVRLERAKELLEEAKDLLDKEAYKSANNRAYYAIEKGLNALLATVEIETSTHNGCLKQFNYHFIHNGNGAFLRDDYQKAATAEHIRNISDYDDFYIASKDETKEQVENAEYLLKKIESYLAQ